jgi:hypothetical protein
MDRVSTSHPTCVLAYLRVLAVVLVLLAVLLPLVNCGTAGNKLNSIAITPAHPSVAKGDQMQMHAIGTYENGTQQDLTDVVTWQYNNPTVISLTVKGEVTALAEGAAMVAASSQGATAHTYVTVGAPVLVEIAVTPNPLSVPLGESRQLAATGTYSDGSTQDLTHTATWTSSATATATVSATGMVAASGLGSATITAASGSVTGSAPVNVSQAALLSIAVAPSQSSLPQGETEQLTATGTYSDGSTQNLTPSITWTSSSSTIAAVSATGAILANTPGTATITAAAVSVSGSATVTVSAPVVVALNITPATLSIVLESSSQIHATAIWSNGATQDVTSTVSWSAVPTGFVSITYFGLVTAQQVGTATIFASYGGATGTATVTVTPLMFISYFNRTNAKDSGIDGVMRIVNPGLTANVSAGNLCAMIYVFDANQELNECCGCSISDHGLRTLSLLHDLTNNPLTGVKPAAGSILMIPSSITQNPQCNPSSLTPTGALPAWETNDQPNGDGTYSVTEASFHAVSLNSGIAANLAGICSFIQSDGSGHGVCSCGSGGQ